MPYLPCLSFLKGLCKSKLKIMLILSRPHIFVVTEKGSHSKLLISKRHAYGFGKNSSMLLLSYFSNHWKRTKIKTSFSSRTVLFQGVPQGLVFGLSLVNISLNFSFWIITFAILQMTVHLLFLIKPYTLF